MDVGILTSRLYIETSFAQPLYVVNDELFPRLESTTHPYQGSSSLFKCYNGTSSTNDSFSKLK